MKRKLIRSAAKAAGKLFVKRKVNKMERTLSDVVQLTKVNELLKKSENNEKFGKVLKIVLICTGIFAICVAIGFIAYRILGQREDDYDLYDDLDNYYNEADHYEADLDVNETDFAE